MDFNRPADRFHADHLGSSWMGSGGPYVYYPYQYQGAEANSFVNDPDFFLWSLVISLEVGIFLMGRASHLTCLALRPIVPLTDGGY